jgi:ABC-type transporter MlaC component
MKTTKIAIIVSVLVIATSFSLLAQTQKNSQQEIPSWVVKQAKEYVAKFKDELKLSPADSTIFTDEFISRTLRTSAACKLANTPEEKKEAAAASTKEYFENLKKKISSALYGKYMAFLNKPKSN